MLIIDNATNLNNKVMTSLYDQLKIKHHNVIPYRPKINGAIEVENKNLKRIIEKITITYKD